MKFYVLIFLLLLGISLLVSLFRLFGKKQKYGVESVTKRGEKVRSKKEKIVADYLFDHNIEYEYEKEIDVNGQKMLTDFYLPKYKLYIEYWGLDKVENKTGDEYRARKAEKIELYDKGNLRLISLNQDDIPDLEKVFPRKLNALINTGTKSKTLGGLKSVLFGKTKSEFHCTSCGAELSVEGEFCINCGESEGIFCDSCGSREPVETEFCSSCGNALQSS